MQHLGFGQIWRDIISGLLGSSTTQVLLNSTLGKRIFHMRGLRQEDPLSPMTFLLVMDVLGHMFSKVAEDGMLQPLVRRVLPHQNSLYADDVVLFICPEEADIAIAMDILHPLEMLRGSKQIFRKVIFFQSGVRSRTCRLSNDNCLVLSQTSHVSIWGYLLL
jgi:hypothetical protein